MSVVDLLLNLACLLLWLNWCSVGLDPLEGAKASTLAGTLKKTEPARSRRWLFLAAVVVLLVLRTGCYWQLGPALDWSPRLDLTATVLHFRSDQWDRMFAFSLLTFGRTLVLFYLGVTFLTIVNRRPGDTNIFLKFSRLYLGRLARWPWPVLVLLFLLLGVALWMGLHPLLVRLGVVPRARQSAQLFQQGLLVVAHEVLALRYLIAAVLLGHLVNSYVYLGRHGFWDFINETGRNLLRPLGWLPLRLGRVDFAPVVLIALVFGLSELALRFLPKLNPL